MRLFERTIPIAVGVFALVTTATVTGCADVPGNGFAELEPRVQAAWTVPQDRVRNAGWVQLSSEYQIRLAAGAVTITTVEVLAEGNTGGDTQPQTFDPTNPPPGYSLCHNGHCHAEDGELVDYAEIEAKLSAGGGASLRPVVTLVGPSVELLTGFDAALPCDEQCALPDADLRRIGVTLQGLTLRGTVRDSSPLARLSGPRAWQLQLPADRPLQLTQTVKVPVGVEEPFYITTAIKLNVGPSLFDEIDWAAEAATQNTAAPLDLGVSDASLRVLIRAIHQEVLSVDVTHREGRP